MSPDEPGRLGGDDALDFALRDLPADIEPGRDLWPEIAARIATEGRAATRRPAWPMQAAAAVLLVVASSLLTATWLGRREAAAPAIASAPTPVVAESAVRVVPAAFGPSGTLDAEYVAARKQLSAMLEARIASMPESARTKLELNLGELRRAADQINEALAVQPGDALLEELLLKTYQDELAVLANVNQLTSLTQTTGGMTAVDAPTRIQL
jgi:hypothetical protein